MLKHEMRLIEPDADQIVAALTETVAAANKRCRTRLIEDEPAKWRKFARDSAAEPEGFAMYRGGRGGVPATQVLAAWWTDAAGRKHVVLRGRRVEHEDAKRLLQPKDLADRPPLFHAYPEYVCRRFVEGRSEIVCACGCGVVGTPEALGWMGATCGPCFDRAEESGKEALAANLPGVLYSDRATLATIACSRDGTRVAAVEGVNSATYWDIATRTRTLMKFSGAYTTSVAITPDGRRLVVVGSNPFDNSRGLFASFDLTTDPPTRINTDDPDQVPSWTVTALPNPDRVLVRRCHPPGFENRAHFVDSADGQVKRSVLLHYGASGPFAVSPDGKRFATQGRCVQVFDANSRTLWQEESASDATVFSHDGSRVITAGGNGLTAYDAATGKRLSSTQRRYGGKSPPATLVTDPGGAWIYGSGYDGWLVAFAADTLEAKAAFEWHLGPILGLAISADGSRLFTGGGDGCVKVWPIRDLMRGV
jgi:hypothetical protein